MLKCFSQIFYERSKKDLRSAWTEEAEGPSFRGRSSDPPHEYIQYGDRNPVVEARLMLLVGTGQRGLWAVQRESREHCIYICIYI